MQEELADDTVAYRKNAPLLPRARRRKVPQKLAPCQWIWKKIAGVLLRWAQTKEERRMAGLRQSLADIQEKLRLLEEAMTRTEEAAATANDTGNIMKLSREVKRTAALREQYRAIVDQENLIQQAIEGASYTSDMAQTVKLLQETGYSTSKALESVDTETALDAVARSQDGIRGNATVWERHSAVNTVMEVHGPTRTGELDQVRALYAKLYPKRASPESTTRDAEMETVPRPVQQYDPPPARSLPAAATSD